MLVRLMGEEQKLSSLEAEGSVTWAVSWRIPTGSDRESLLVEKESDMYDGMCLREALDRVSGRVGVPGMLAVNERSADYI